MSTPDTAALWSATALAFDEKKLASAGLSIRQRKLLALLSTPASVAQLAQGIAQPEVEVQAALERFAKLGLAQSDAAVPLNPMQARSQVLSRTTAEVAASSSRTPIMVGGAVAALALLAATAWLLRGGTPVAPTSAPVAKNGAATARTPAASTPSENTDTAAPSTAVAANSGASSTVGANAAAAPPSRPPTVAPTTAPATAPTTAPAPSTAAAALPAAAKASANALPLSVPGKTIVLPTPAANTPTVANIAPSVPATSSTTAPASSAATVAPTPAPLAAAPAPTPAAAATVAPAAVAAAPAVAAPTPAVAAPRPAPAREIKLVNRVEPTFPRGVDTERGTVRARLQVDAKGVVTSVEIVEANPPRVFDRTVRSALQQWRYEPTGEAFSTAAEISFAR